MSLTDEIAQTDQELAKRYCLRNLVLNGNGVFRMTGGAMEFYPIIFKGSGWPGFEPESESRALP